MFGQPTAFPGVPVKRASSEAESAWAMIIELRPPRGPIVGRLLPLPRLIRTGQAGAPVWRDLLWASEAAVSEDANGVRR